MQLGASQQFRPGAHGLQRRVQPDVRLALGRALPLHAKSGQPGGITRLLACEPAKLRTYRGLDIGPTFVHHNHRGKKGMNYAAFNKPASVYYRVRSGRVPPVWST